MSEVHDGDAVGDLADHRQVVRDEDVRQVEVALQVAQEVEHLRLDRDVERRDRLVADDQLRRERERTRDADPLALAARELVRVAVVVLRAQPDASRAAPARASWPCARRGSRRASRRSGRRSCADSATSTDPGRSSASPAAAASAGAVRGARCPDPRSGSRRRWGRGGGGSGAQSSTCRSRTRRRSRASHRGAPSATRPRPREPPTCRARRRPVDLEAFRQVLQLDEVVGRPELDIGHRRLVCAVGCAHAASSPTIAATAR